MTDTNDKRTVRFESSKIMKAAAAVMPFVDNNKHVPTVIESAALTDVALYATDQYTVAVFDLRENPAVVSEYSALEKEIDNPVLLPREALQFLAASAAAAGVKTNTKTGAWVEECVTVIEGREHAITVTVETLGGETKTSRSFTPGLKMSYPQVGRLIPEERQPLGFPILVNLERLNRLNPFLKKYYKDEPVKLTLMAMGGGKTLSLGLADQVLVEIDRLVVLIAGNIRPRN